MKLTLWTWALPAKHIVHYLRVSIKPMFKLLRTQIKLHNVSNSFRIFSFIKYRSNENIYIVMVVRNDCLMMFMVKCKSQDTLLYQSFFTNLHTGVFGIDHIQLTLAESFPVLDTLQVSNASLTILKQN